jgi:hypothetical protein
MNDKYILDGQIPIPVGDLVEWAQWFEKADRHVAQDVIEGIRISTVFLGLDHSFGRTPYPILFETMVFGGKFDPDCKHAIKTKPTGNRCPMCNELMMEGTKTIPERCSVKTCPMHNPHKMGEPAKKK